MGWLNELRFRLGGLTDEQAMWRVQMEGDPEAFAELVRRWERPLQRLGVRMTGDERDGEDLAQEAFARVFAHRQEFQQGRKFSTWLWRIALNLCYDHRRRLSRRAESPLEEEAMEEPALCAVESGPDGRLLEEERAGWVRAALLRLPETHRAVLVLREYEGLKLREIAEVLEIPEGTVKSRLADGLTQLSRQLQPALKNGDAALAGMAGARKERSML
jgi:RNA polymerase sigma-70 factor, ECF subfamily